MFEFISQYIKNPRTIGAIAPSGKALARKMMEPINFKKAKCIVEYGPGLGSFTRELIERMPKETELILIEQNELFCERLSDEFGHRKNVTIICGDAANVNEYLHERGIQSADYIISGLPFTSLPKQVSNQIFRATICAIGDRGRFITFQYTLIKKKFFEQYFNLCGCLFEIKNLPPAYVLVMKNERK
jgi:phospholipid N-methyltransferase